MLSRDYSSQTGRKYRKWLVISCLVISGELIFGLPFHIARFYRPILLDVFQLNNTQLGDALAVYGVTAMLSYFPSGLIADRLSSRKLMSLSLAATAVGGMVLMSIPGLLTLSLLYGFWGVTTILLFWSAMMRVTREWGGKFEQGQAFGLLDGGRGLVASAVASVGVFILAFVMPGEIVNSISDSDKRWALQLLILFYSFITFGAAILVWFIIPETKIQRLEENPFRGILQVLKNRITWLQAFIVVCAYCGYKGLDFYAQFGMDVLQMNEIDASRFVSNASYIRPLAAVGAGFIADRFTSGKTIVISFMVLSISCLGLSVMDYSGVSSSIIIMNLLVSFASVYALRGIYFALFEETKVPHHLTGTTVGIVSLLGFAPDVFFNSIAGRILDTYREGIAYQYFFMLLTCFSLVGLASSLFIMGKVKK